MVRRLLWILGLSGLAAGQVPSIATVRVPATANPFLAGMPRGARSSFGDSAPRQSPVLVPLPLADAVAVTLTVSGGSNHVPSCPPMCDPLDGGLFTAHQDGAENGISNVVAPYDSLLGVFLTDDQPDRSRAPKTLDFTRIGTKFTSVAPLLRQVFFIGAGVNKDGSKRRCLVPRGATRLFLANMDSYEWSNNTGGFVVTVSIERADVSSSMLDVDSKIAFSKWTCMPDRAHCTPAREIVEERGAGRYHVVLPAQLEWGASIPAGSGAAVTISGVTGSVCLDGQSAAANNCWGQHGNNTPAGEGFLVPGASAGSLVSKTDGGRTYFSVNGRAGAGFDQHQGFFEFDVLVN
jgi:hypothetical protein